MSSGTWNKKRTILINNCFQCNRPCAFFYCIRHEIARRARDKHRKELRQRFKGVY